MSRVGLFSLFVLLAFFSFSASAPVPSRSFSLAERYGNSDELLKRSLDNVFVDREFNTAYSTVYNKRDYLSKLDGRDLDEAYGQYTKREFENLFTLNERDFDDDLESEFTKRDLQVLQRRSKITRKIDHAFKTAAHKVGHFFKTTGAKVAKFGLKVAAAGASVLSKAAKIIPGVGTGISTALKGVATGANAASDKIHANLGKLNKVDKGLNYVINPVGTAGKKLGKKGKVLGALVG